MTGEYGVIIEHDSQGWYVATVPARRGWVTQIEPPTGRAVCRPPPAVVQPLLAAEETGSKAFDESSYRA